MPVRARTTRSGGRGVSGGFTLIELLVVISVIALLIGILIPTLGQARESARRLKCLTNLRAIGTAFQLYMQNESKGILPKVNPLHDPNAPQNDQSLLDVLSKYIDAPIPRRSFDPDGPFVVTDPFLCPSDREPDETGQTVAQSVGTSYEYGAGGAMLIAELRLVRNPALGVTRAYEQNRDWPIAYDAQDWHKLRKDGLPRNATYFNDWRADWMIQISSDELESFFEDAFKAGGLPG